MHYFAFRELPNVSYFSIQYKSADLNMWLTSWWVAWLLNFYGFSHTNCSIKLYRHAMAFHETVSVLQGTPWHSMELNNPWNSMDLQGNSMEFHGIPWNSMTTSWNSVELYGIAWNSMDTPWNSMAFHGTPWILHGSSMEFHGFPWISMEFHGGISHGVETIK